MVSPPPKIHHCEWIFGWGGYHKGFDRLKAIDAIEIQSGPGFKIQDSRKSFLRILDPD